MNTPIQQAENIRLHSDTIRKAVMAILKELQTRGPILTPEVELWLAEEMSDGVVRRLVKFLKGQAEHGGVFIDKRFNVLEAIGEEVIDLEFYLAKLRHDVRKLNSRLEGKDKL